MNRNVNSRFALNPTHIDMPRSRFPRDQKIITSFNVGDLIPFYVEEILPGDTQKIRTSKVVRMQTLVAPIMDNVYLDTYYFFVPNRLVWTHWREFMGENTESAWIPQTQYSIPQITSPSSTGWTCGSIADYMGIPIGITDLSVSALPFRAYALICNEWFRDENLTDPLNIPLSDSTQTGTNGTSYINDVANGGAPFKASKYYDYFTGCLPAPQKGPDVTITTGQQAVVGNGYNLALTDGTHTAGIYGQSGVQYKPDAYGVTSPSATGGSGISGFTSGVGLGVPTADQLGTDLAYSGLITTGENIFTISQLRQAFQVQKFYEANARQGSRYIEILKGMFV